MLEDYVLMMNERGTPLNDLGLAPRPDPGLLAEAIIMLEAAREAIRTDPDQKYSYWLSEPSINVESLRFDVWRCAWQKALTMSLSAGRDGQAIAEAMRDRLVKGYPWYEAVLPLAGEWWFPIARRWSEVGGCELFPPLPELAPLRLIWWWRLLCWGSSQETWGPTSGDLRDVFAEHWNQHPGPAGTGRLIEFQPNCDGNSIGLGYRLIYRLTQPDEGASDFLVRIGAAP